MVRTCSSAVVPASRPHRSGLTASFGTSPTAVGAPFWWLTGSLVCNPPGHVSAATSFQHRTLCCQVQTYVVRHIESSSASSSSRPTCWSTVKALPSLLLVVLLQLSTASLADDQRRECRRHGHAGSARLSPRHHRGSPAMALGTRSATACSPAEVDRGQVASILSLLYSLLCLLARLVGKWEMIWWDDATLGFAYVCGGVEHRDEIRHPSLTLAVPV